MGPPGPGPSLARLQGLSVEEASAGGASPCSPWGQVGRPGAAWAPEGRALRTLAPNPSSRARRTPLLGAGRRGRRVHTGLWARSCTPARQLSPRLLTELMQRPPGAERNLRKDGPCPAGARVPETCACVRPRQGQRAVRTRSEVTLCGAVIEERWPRPPTTRRRAGAPGNTEGLSHFLPLAS